jgi:hypothetical protein
MEFRQQQDPSRPVTQTAMSPISTPPRPDRIPVQLDGCAGTQDAGMMVGHGVGCHLEVRWVAGLSGPRRRAMESTPPQPGSAAGPPHELVVEGREELLYLRGEAAELEHSVCCTYLYAAFSLRAEPGEGLTVAQLPVVAGWRRAINEIALQEMIHPALVNNLLAALGGRLASAAQSSPALPLRARDPADPGAVQRTDAAAIPPHRAARRPGHLHDGWPTGGEPAASCGADWTARAAGAAGLL